MPHCSALHGSRHGGRHGSRHSAGVCLLGALDTSWMAASVSRPEGEPSGPLRMLPPGGAGVAGPMPASRSATELARAMWASCRISRSGVLGAAAMGWVVG